MVKEQILDALIVGAGFSGLHTLSKLRKLGFSVKIYETGSDLGGTWFWNRYPGARVDSETPIYQLSEEREVWSDFEWRERFPGRTELQRYFHHADKKLDLSKDIEYNTCVTAADWDPTKNLWLIKTNTALTTWARHFILCTGFAAKRYTPPFKGLDKFKGTWHHSGVWPEEGVNLKGKKVAVIGTGASGVQIIQEIGREVAHLTVYQRTPNLAIPMRQCYSKDGNNTKSLWKFPEKTEYEKIFQVKIFSKIFPEY
jgi:cation diffusion facilitator CzcD-associated flavoprotein CzcO